MVCLLSVRVLAQLEAKTIARRSPGWEHRSHGNQTDPSEQLGDRAIASLVRCGGTRKQLQKWLGGRTRSRDDLAARVVMLDDWRPVSDRDLRHADLAPRSC